MCAPPTRARRPNAGHPQQAIAASRRLERALDGDGRAAGGPANGAGGPRAPKPKPRAKGDVHVARPKPRPRPRDEATGGADGEGYSDGESSTSDLLLEEGASGEIVFARRGRHRGSPGARESTDEDYTEI
eukprot:2479626-Prymnesium_polylepis.2